MNVSLKVKTILETQGTGIYGIISQKLN